MEELAQKDWERYVAFLREDEYDRYARKELIYWADERIKALEEVYAAAKRSVDNPAWAGICDEDIELERAIRELEESR